MPRKKVYTPSTMEKNEAPQLERALQDVYTKKLEYSLHNSATVTYPYVVTGSTTTSATGSPTITLTINISEAYGTIYYASAQALSDVVTAHVVSLANSSIGVTLRSISGTANFSDVTTAVVSVRYFALGDKP